MVSSIRKSFGLLAVPLALLALTGCGGSEEGFTVSVAGNYTVALTNRDSTCPFEDWVVGKQASGIGLNVTQTGNDLHATVDGITAIWLALALGSAEFDGAAHGYDLELTNYGTRSQMQDKCTFTYNATVQGTLTGDSIAGSITYSPQTNGNPGCEDVECSAVQEFSGSRPPAP